MAEKVKTVWSWSRDLTEAEVWAALEPDGDLLPVGRLALSTRDQDPNVILLPEGRYIRLPDTGRATFTVTVQTPLRLPGELPRILLENLQSTTPDGYVRIRNWPSYDPVSSIYLACRKEYLGLRARDDDRARPEDTALLDRIQELPLRWFEGVRAAILRAEGGSQPSAWNWEAADAEARPKLRRFLVKLFLGRIPPALVCPADLEGRPDAAALVEEVEQSLALRGEGP